MNRAPILSFLFLVAASTALAQESHIESRYEKSIDRTIVRSDVLYVINSPSQFMQIRFGGQFPGKGRPSQLPDQIYFDISSYSPNALYQLDAKHRLLVKADDKVIDFGSLTYWNIEGPEKKQKSNPKPLKTNYTLSAALPPAAVIVANTKREELTAEFMSLNELSLADLRLLARANEVTMKIGDTVFPLRPMHKTILREFADAITPANVGSISPPPVERHEMPPDLPSAANQTKLAETLKWLKVHIERNGATNDIVTPKRFEPLAFDSCQIAYRTVPLIRTSKVSSLLVNAIMEYQVDLADLNADATRTSEIEDYATVTFVTRDYQPKIKLFKRANNTGTVSRTLEEALTEIAILNFKNKAAALQFREAFVHAINLCKAQQ